MWGGAHHESQVIPWERGEGPITRDSGIRSRMAQLQEPRGAMLPGQQLGGMHPGIHRAGPEGMVAGLPVPSFLAVSLKVFPGPSVHLEFQLKLWLGIVCV